MNTKIGDIEILESIATLEAITPEMSGLFLREYLYDLQRPVGSKNIEQMERAMARGAFPITTLLLCKSLETGKTDLLDGFHRLTCSRNYNHTFKATIQRITVRTEADKKALWLFIDGGGALRCAASYRPMLREEMAGISGYRLGAFERGCGAIVHQFSEKYLLKWRCMKVPTGERIEVIESYLPYAKEYFSALRRPSARIAGPLGAGFVVALGVILVEAQGGIAIPFFRSIAANEGLAKGDPRWLFAESLCASGALTRDTLRTMQRLALCWNSHHAREQRLTFRDLGPGVVVPIKGTKYQIGGSA